MILVTGSTGFVGKRLLAVLPSNRIRAMMRTYQANQPVSTFIGEVNKDAKYGAAFEGVSTVIHLAAQVPSMSEDGSVLTRYRDINVHGTLNLARQAAAHGVKRFIFLSSIKVNGESTSCDESFSTTSVERPTEPYGVSKYEAENGLKILADETDLEVVIIRAPIIYGSGVKGNFASIITLAQKNLPLPLGAINNRRSLVALDNLVDLIIACIDHPNAANQTFLVSDGRDVSTTELLEILTRAVGKKPRLIPLPKKWLRFVGKLVGQEAIVERLCGNLQIDITYTKQTLDWEPPVSFEEGINRCFDDKSC